ncbi:unnamed protein product [Ascophyllum nodosum]
MAATRRIPKDRKARRRTRPRKEGASAAVVIFRIFVALLIAWVAFYLIAFARGGDQGDADQGSALPGAIRGSRPPRDEVPATGSVRMELLERLFRIGEKDPSALARVLEEEDPLQVCVASPDHFHCPPREEERFSLPDARNRTVEREFKEGKGFIYYQHLRKAGGTGFCEMAGRNIPSAQVPMYHCMPDNRGAMATPPWSNREFLLNQMDKNSFRITANEWDAFPKEHLTLPRAVFATTFRHPVDRWYSQYRFEHVEHRDGTSKDSTPLPFNQWFKRMKPYIMGDNYYVKTFCGIPNRSDADLMDDVNRKGRPKHEQDLSWSYHKFNSWGQKVTWDNFLSAIEILERFNLILMLDFVDDEMWALEEALGWTQQRRVVLPHEKQAVRKDKKSIPAREALDEDVWAETVQSNVFDLLLFHWAKRMYLERSACRPMDERVLDNLPPKPVGPDFDAHTGVETLP